MSDLFDKGIKLSSGFSLGAKSPLDTREVVEDISERDALITSNIAYEGMIVYVKTEKKHYKLVDLTTPKWEELGSGSGGDLSDYQKIDEDTLTTNDKTIPGAINELDAEIGNITQSEKDDTNTGLIVVADGTLTDNTTEIEEKDVLGIATVGEYVKLVNATGINKILEDTDDRLDKIETVKNADFKQAIIDEVLDGVQPKYVTQAEYDSLSDTDKNNPKIEYHITDAPIVEYQLKTDDDLTTTDKTTTGAINELDLEIGVKEVVGVQAHYETSTDINALTVVADGTLVNSDTEVEESTVNADGSTFQVGDKVVLIPEVLATPSTGLYKEIDDNKDEIINDYLGGKKLIYLTQAEYDLLSDDEKNDDTKVYNITDADSTESDAIITEEITVKGTHCGALEDGDVIPKDTTLTDLVKMLTQKVILPEYVKPTLKLSITPATLKQEVGTVITPVLSYTFTQNDAGAETSHTYSPVDSETQAQLTIVEGNNIEYSVTVNYDEGSQKQDNFGNLNGTPIQAGSLTSKVKSVGYRNMFYGVNTTNNTYADSDSIRGLANKKEVGNVTITVPAGSRQIVIAIPSGKTLGKASYVEQGNADYKDNFVLSTVQVAGATSGQDLKDYNVYIYNLSIPNSSVMTFNVAIA